MHAQYFQMDFESPPGGRSCQHNITWTVALSDDLTFAPQGARMGLGANPKTRRCIRVSAWGGDLPQLVDGDPAWGDTMTPQEVYDRLMELAGEIAR